MIKDEKKTIKTDSVILGSFLYLGFREKMNEEQCFEQLKLEIEKGNIKTDSPIEKGESIHYTYSLKKDLISFTLNFKTNKHLLQYIKIDVDDEEVYIRPVDNIYKLKDKNFNDLHALYQSKYGKNKITNLYQTGVYIVKGKWLEFTPNVCRLYIWEAKDTKIIIERKLEYKDTDFSKSISNIVSVYYYPKDYNYFLEYPEYKTEIDKPEKITKEKI